MKHLDDAAALALVEAGIASTGAELPAHVAGCARCRALMDEYRRLLAAFETVQACGRPPERVLRWARAYAGTAAARPRPRWRLLPCVARGDALVAAVRGGNGISRAVLHGDERHQLDLRLEPAGAGRARLHGQLVPLADDAVEGWTITAVLSSDEGAEADGPRGARTTRTDASGEFWISDLADGERLSLLADNGEERIVIPRLVVGEQPDEEH
jgi:hypothetical protein